jgi:hypothetical protein
MKPKQIHPICTNCAHAELYSKDDIAGYHTYNCKEHDTVFLVDILENKCGKYGIWSTRCNFFKSKES